MVTSTFRDPGTGKTFSFKHDKGLTSGQLQALAQDKLVKGLNRQGNALTRGLGTGIDLLQQGYGSSLEGIGSTFNLETLEEIGAGISEEQERQMESRRMLAPQDKGIGSYIAELAGTSAPISGAGLAGAATGAAIGSLAGPLGTAVGGFVGGMSAMLPFFYGQNRERQKEAIERGFRTEIDEGAAALTAVPQAALDSILNKFVVTKVGGLFTKEAVKAGGGVFTRAGRGVARGVVTETPTELGQQVLERYQAGLPMDSDEAIDEYVAAASGGAVLGGLLGGGAGALSRSDVSQITEAEVDEVDEVGDGSVVKEPTEGEGGLPVFKFTYTDSETKSRVDISVAAQNAEEAVNQAKEQLGNTVVEDSFSTPFLQKPVEPEPAPTPEVEPEPTPEPKDIEYERLVKENPEAARKMLREEAEANGYNTEAFHGTYSEGIKKFAAGTHFGSKGAANKRNSDVRKNIEAEQSNILNSLTKQNPIISKYFDVENDADVQAIYQKYRDKYDELDTDGRGFGGESETSKPVPKELIDIQNETDALVLRKLKEGLKKQKDELEIERQKALEGSDTPKLKEKVKEVYDDIIKRDTEVSESLIKDYEEAVNSLTRGSKVMPVFLKTGKIKRTVDVEGVDEMGNPIEEGSRSIADDFEEGVDTLQYTNLFEGGESFVIKNSEQAKSGELIVKDEGGNVIPLSQRFTDKVTDQVSEPEVTAEAAPFVAPQKAELSHVQQKDIIDMDALIDDIVENDIPVWFWYADQLGDGDFKLPSGGSINLDAGPSYALQPANRKAGRVWASSKSVKEINNKISQLKYKDKDGKEKTGYIFLVSGSPNTMFLFNKQAFQVFYRNAFKRRKFTDVKAEILDSRPTKPVRDALNNHNSLNSLLDSADSRPFIEGLLFQRGKSTPLAEYLDSKGFFNVENKQLRDGFYRENNFNLNDILLVVQPTKADNRTPNHGTYKTPVYGKVIGVPDKKVDAYLLIPDNVRGEKSITMEPAMAAQVVAPYGARVTNIKKVAGSEQAQRAVSNLRRVIEESPDGFTVDTAGEFATGGYIVAPEKSTEQVIDQDNFNEESLTQYIINNSANLNVEGAMLGGWYNSANKQYVLDVVFAIDNEQNAVDIAIWGDQDAIFNLDTKTEIRTKDDNKNPTTPQGDTRSAGEILSRKPTENLSEYSSQRRRDPRGVRQAVPGQAGQDVTAQVAPTEPGGTFNQNTLYDFITDNFLPVSRKIGVDIVTNYGIAMARYNASQGVIEYNPTALAQQDQRYITAAMREEMIHAAMSKVILQKAKGKKEGEAFKSFMSSLGKSLTPEQRTAIAEVYSGLETDAQFGAEYSRAAIQQLLYGDVTESFITQGPAFTKLKNLLRSVQSYLARTFGADVTTDPEAAGIIRASAELLQAADPNARPTNQKVVDESLAYSTSVNPNTEITSQEVAESGKPPNEKKLNLNFANRFLVPVSGVLKKIHPELSRLLKDYYSSIHQDVLKYQTRMAPFFKKMKGIKNKKDARRLKQLLFFSPKDQENLTDADKSILDETDKLLRKYGMFNDYNLHIKPLLKIIRQRLVDTGVPVGELYRYMPRKIKDLEKVKSFYNKGLRDSFVNFIRDYNASIQNAKAKILLFNNETNPEEKKKLQPTKKQYELADQVPIQIGSVKTRAFEAQQWDIFTRTGQFQDKLPGNIKKRKIALIPEQILDLYEDPGVAMEAYIYNMVSATANVKLIGRKFTTGTSGTSPEKASALAVLIQKLRSNEEISFEDADGTVPEIFRVILTPQGAENVFAQFARTFGYGTLLVEFTSTLSQLYDLPFIMMDNGVFGTLGAMTGQRINAKDFGIDVDQVSAEFVGDNRSMANAVRLGLKLTGFTKLDQFMKETNMTANYRRYQKLARGYFRNRNTPDSKKFVAELTSMGYSEQEQVQLIADLKKGNRNSAYVRSLIINKLSETQPLTQAEMAMGIVGNPNLRFTVAMKSFMVKQINFAKERILDEFVQGVRTNNKTQIARASKELTKLLLFMVLCGMPVDALKDFLAGRIGYLDDYLFNGIFRVAGISKYTTYQVRKDGPGEAFIDYLTPVAIQQFSDITEALTKVTTGQQAITDSKLVSLAPFSDVINRIFGFQKERERRQLKRRKKEGDRPFLVPPGAI